VTELRERLPAHVGTVDPQDGSAPVPVTAGQSAELAAEGIETSLYAEPAAEPEIVSGAVVLDAAVRNLKRFLWLDQEEYYDLLVLWAAHTWVYEVFPFSPRLAFTGDEPGCGKTFAEEMTGYLCSSPTPASSVTPAALKMLIAQRKPTLLLDETDKIFGATRGKNQDLQQVVKVGYKRGMLSWRVLKSELVAEETYCPVIMDGIGNLPKTIASRTMVIPMRKPPKGAGIDRFIDRMHIGLMQKAGQSVGLWARSRSLEMGDIIPEPLDEFALRGADITDTLRVIGMTAGDGWEERAVGACRAVLLGKADPEKVTVPLDIRLLAAIRDLWDGDRMPSSAICSRLLAAEPWSEMWTAQTAQAQLAGMLAPFGIEPKVLRNCGQNGESLRGYESGQFTEAWGTMLQAPK